MRTWIALSVALAAGATFFNSLDGEFVVDDQHTVEKNQVVRGNLTDVAAFFAHDYWSFRPLASLSLALDHALCGLRPRCYHATNIALHSLASALAAFAAPRLIGGSVPPLASWAAGMLFATHPLHTEAVANISGRAELLSACFVLTAILLYPAPRGRDGPPLALARTVGAVALIAAATLAKESGVTGGGVLMAWEVVELLPRRPRRKQQQQQQQQRQRERRGLWAAACPTVLALALGAIIAGRLRVQAGLPSFQAGDNALPFIRDPATRWRTLLHWNALSLAWLAWPWTHCPDYSGTSLAPVACWADPRNALTAVVAATALFTAAASAAAALRGSRTGRACLVAGAAVVGPYLPASQWLFYVGFTVAERVMYLPVFGLALAAAAAVAWARRAQPQPATRRARLLLLLALSSLFLASAAVSLARAQRWRSHFVLWSSTAIHCSPNSKVLNNLGKAYQRRSDYDVADALFHASIQSDPMFPHPYFNLGYTAQRRGWHEAAIHWYDRCTAVEPRFHTAYNNKAAALIALGRHREANAALAQYRRAVAAAASIRPSV